MRGRDLASCSMASHTWKVKSRNASFVLISLATSGDVFLHLILDASSLATRTLRIFAQTRATIIP
jgi:hypothetical protein